MREQQDKKAKAVSSSAKKSAQLVEVANVDLFVACEIIAVADKSISQIDESQVLVQPGDAVYSEVGQEDGDENLRFHNKVFHSETSENLSMTVQLSDNMCEVKLARSGSAVEEEDISHLSQS